MKQFTQHELDEKIHSFMSRKISKFPELKKKHEYTEKEISAARSKFKRLYVSPFMQLETQYR